MRARDRERKKESEPESVASTPSMISQVIPEGPTFIGAVSVGAGLGFAPFSCIYANVCVHVCVCVQVCECVCVCG